MPWLIGVVSTVQQLPNVMLNLTLTLSLLSLLLAQVTYNQVQPLRNNYLAS